VVVEQQRLAEHRRVDRAQIRDEIRPVQEVAESFIPDSSAFCGSRALVPLGPQGISCLVLCWCCEPASKRTCPLEKSGTIDSITERPVSGHHDPRCKSKFDGVSGIGGRLADRVPTLHGALRQISCRSLRGRSAGRRLGPLKP